MRTRLFLSPANNKLVGAFQQEADVVHVILDSSEAPFSVQLPDVTMPQEKEFAFYNFPANNIGFDVTIVPVNGQNIIINSELYIVKPFETVSFCADLKTRWLVKNIRATISENWKQIESGADLVWYHLENGSWVERFRMTGVAA